MGIGTFGVFCVIHLVDGGLNCLCFLLLCRCHSFPQLLTISFGTWGLWTLIQLWLGQALRLVKKGYATVRQRLPAPKVTISGRCPALALSAKTSCGKFLDAAHPERELLGVSAATTFCSSSAQSIAHDIW